MPALEYLKWDSDFFGKKIGKCEFHTPEDILASNHLLAEAKSQQYALVYLFTPESQLLPNTVCEQFKAKLVDTRLTYTCQVDQAHSISNANIDTVDPTEDRSQLYNLAYQAGQYSRFKVDPCFSEDVFQQLYRRWIDKSLDSVTAEKVFAYRSEGEIAAMITVKISGGVGRPELMATDYTQRGKGIGKACFNHMLAYLHSNKIAQMELFTQQANQEACLLYEKMNYQLSAKMNIYHVWL